MNQRSFDLIVGVVFLLIALGHLLRVVFSVPFVVNDIPIPMWASAAAAVAMGYLAYSAFLLARSPDRRN